MDVIEYLKVDVYRGPALYRCKSHLPYLRNKRIYFAELSYSYTKENLEHNYSVKQSKK